jgi:hypothetical protein
MNKFYLCLFLISNALFAAESDNFTARKLNLIDVASDVNLLANDYLKQAITKINAEGNCDEAKAEDKLYEELQKYFANHSNGELVKTILNTNKVEKNNLALKESVYGRWEKHNGFLLGKASAASSPLALSPLIQIGDQPIGVDKLEHMFGMGFSYFTKFYGEGVSIKEVLKLGILMERTILGGNFLATGVFSYGDLSANFNGMRFWNHMLLKKDDILGKEYNLGPYIKCVGSKWQANEESTIDFRNYIEASMDESINCSKFANISGQRRFTAAIKKLGFSCPVDPAKLLELKEKYKAQNIEHFILNYEGTATSSYFNEF